MRRYAKRYRRSRRPVRTVTIAISLVAAIGIPALTFAAGGAQRRTNPGEFVSVCAFDHHSGDDPLLYPGLVNRSFDSVFAGNTTTNAVSTVTSLRNATSPSVFGEGFAGTSCGRAADRSAYWAPTLVKGSNAYNPRVLRVSYRTGDVDPASITPMPPGLKLMAGNSAATSAQSTDIAAWACSEPGKTEVNVAKVPQCSPDQFLRIRVRFPNCWNGRDLDSADHKSHLAYSSNGKCPRTHPIAVPQLTITARYRGVSGSGVLLACGSAYCASASFVNAWNASVHTSLVTSCLKANVDCGDTGGPGGGVDVFGSGVPDVEPAPVVKPPTPPTTPATTTTSSSTTTTTATTVPRATTTTLPITTTPTTFTLDGSFDRPSKSDPSNYRQKVDFNVVCKVARVAADDPIVWPGQAGAAHMHVFTGNTSTNADSTQQSLLNGGTNCLLDRDTATYWMPALYTNGVEVRPYHMRAYYRAGSLNPVAHIPAGLRIIAGDAHAMVPQDKKVSGWQCRSVSPDVQTVGKQATIPTCPSTDLLEGSVVFPNCWDGVNLDSPDHKSHMSYSWADGNPDNCDAAHPVQLPQLTIAYRYRPGTTNSSSYLSAMNSGLTLHADFWNSWHQSTLDALVDRCINAGVHCGDVSPSHFPGPIP